MEGSEYRSIVKGLGAHKSFGQNFLVNASIAAMEAEYARGMNVIELGPGLGILTEELCRTAKRVTAIEKDDRLAEILRNRVESKRLKLINDDFFSIDYKSLGKIDIMVSNIPYNLSSKVIYWLGKSDIPALICVQKEFAEHMVAKPGTRDYSKLSVVSTLRFRVHKVKEVGRGNFYPVPRVDSCIIYLAPKSGTISDSVISTISLIMNHKKKRLKNTIVDSASGFSITKERARRLAAEIKEADSRPFQLEAEKMLEIAQSINGALAD